LRGRIALVSSTHNHPEVTVSAYSSQDSTYETYPMPVVRPETVHFGECWEHNDRASLTLMIAATRELLAGTAVCDDPEHEANALAEWLDIAEQNEAISRKG
jgi:hypothetical protein